MNELVEFQRQRIIALLNKVDELKSELDESKEEYNKLLTFKTNQ
jgi:hypothetical protein